MQFGGGGVPPVGVLFDAAFDRPSDLLTLALLHGLEGKSEMRQAALAVNRPDLPAAQFCDAVKRFYTPGGFFGGVLPIGLTDGKPRPLPIYSALLAKKADDSAPLYKPAVTRLLDTADPATVFRNALTASQPKNSIIVASGSLATVARLVSLRGAKEVIAETVRYLVLADPKIADPESAQKFFADWPTPVYLCGAEIGDAIRFPAACVEKDFPMPDKNPVVDAYRAFGQMPYDAPTTSLDAALFAVRQSSNYFKLSEPGAFRVSSAGAIEHTPSADGRHRRLLLDETQKDAVIKALTELAVAPPRAGGGRRGARGAAAATPPPPVKKQ